MSAHGDHSARAATALARLAESDPAFAALALWCRHRDGEGGAAPAWSDGATIFYGPGFARLSLDEQIGLAGHHILHIALRHSSRAETMRQRFGGSTDAPLYNIAADAIVNECLVAAGYVLPRPFVTLSDVLDGLPGAETEADALAEWDTDRLFVALMARPDRRKGRRRGRTGRGDRDPMVARAEERGFVADLERREGGGEGDPTEASDGDWGGRLTRALEAGRGSGRGLGRLAGRLGDLPVPRTPWELVLRGLLARAVAQFPRISHARPARRWLALDSAARRGAGSVPAFQPGELRDRRIARIAVGLDVSSSIDDERLRLFAAQIAGIGRRTGAEVHVLVFDETVREVRRMTGTFWERAITEAELPRGGGTSFVDVVERSLALDPSAIVILTDLDGPFGRPPGRVPTIWAVPDAPAQAPPFGRVLSLAR